jgi:hypothetical protein
MGYELDRIMAQYGVATPSAVYGGMAPVAPVAPVYSEQPASGSLSLNSLGRLGGVSAGAPVVATPSYEQQVDAYNTLLAKYNEDMPRYLAEKARAEQAAALHEAAIKAGGMYNQSQFGYQGGNPDMIQVSDIPKPDFTPLAPLAYISSSLGTNAAGGRTGLDTTGGMGGEGSGSGGSSGEGPTGVSTTGGFGTMGALGLMGQVALGTVANAMSSPNTQAQQDAISVVDMGTMSQDAVSEGISAANAAAAADAPSVSADPGGSAANSGPAAPGGGEAPSADSSSSSSSSAAAGASDGSGSGAGAGTGGASAGDSGDGGAGAASAGDGWAKGGAVRRKFKTGGLNDLTDKYELSADEAALPTPAVSADPLMAQKPAPAPVTGAQAPAAGAPAGMPAGLGQMLARYQGGPEGSMYGTELKAARTAASAESEKFAKMIEGAMTQGGESAPSKAEMYFRLAAAFGTPTRTGSFGESLGAAGKAMGEYQKDVRDAEKASRNSKLQLALKGQELRMTGAKDDLNTLRTLAGEEMKDKRAVATKLLEQYIKSGEPESAAGKQAKDEGLRPGTPEYQTRVKKIAENNVETQMSRVNATLANMSVAQANLALAQQKFGFQQDQASKLTGPELKIKSETEDSLNSLKGSMGILKRAFDLNKNSMGGSLVDKGTRLALEASGSKDPVLVNTQELENLLTDQMISSAAEKMKGVLSDSDIKLLSMVSGAKSKNQEERRRIMLNAYGALQRGFEKQQKRLNEINQGLYRETNPMGGLE